MAVSSTPNRVVLNGDGVTTSFNFPYYFFFSTDLVVYIFDPSTGNVTKPVLNTDYTLSGTKNAQGLYQTGANVVFSVAPTLNFTVIIVRIPALLQNYALTQNGIINSVALVQELDYLTLLEQRINDRVARAVRAPDEFGATFNFFLPTTIGLASSAFSVFAINGSSNALIIGPTIQQIASAGAYAGSTSVSAAAAAASATAASVSALNAQSYALVAQAWSGSSQAWAQVSQNWSGTSQTWSNVSQGWSGTSQTWSNVSMAWANSASVIAAGGAVNSVGGLDLQAPTQKGLAVVGTSVFTQSASATAPGLVNNSSQVFAGAKTFNSPISAPAGFLLGGSSVPFTQFLAPTKQIFTSGSGTYTTPTSPRPPLYLKVRMVGGGGGAGGTGTGSPVSGSSGVASTFSGTGVSMNAGGGGLSSSNATSGGGAGTASGGDINAAGGPGTSLIGNTNPAVLGNYGGNGGNSIWGSGGVGAVNGGGNGQIPNGGYGGGGGGAGGNSTISGGAGGGGGGYCELLITSPTTGYSYAVGSGGNGGGAGTSGGAGAKGASGIIIVEEHYQ